MIIGVCCNENVYIVDVYLGFSYYCFKYFVFDVGHAEFGDGRTKRRPHQNAVNLYICVAGGIIEWDFYGTGKKEFYEDFWLYSRRGTEGWL